MIYDNNIRKGCSSHACTEENVDDDDLTQTTCCCNTTNCNDNTFVEKCKQRAALKPKIITCHSSIPDSDRKKCPGICFKNNPLFCPYY